VQYAPIVSKDEITLPPTVRTDFPAAQYVRTKFAQYRVTFLILHPDDRVGEPRRQIDCRAAGACLIRCSIRTIPAFDLMRSACEDEPVTRAIFPAKRSEANIEAATPYLDPGIHRDGLAIDRVSSLALADFISIFVNMSTVREALTVIGTWRANLERKGCVHGPYQ
jgi:hypothetical protein